MKQNMAHMSRQLTNVALHSFHRVHKWLTKTIMQKFHTNTLHRHHWTLQRVQYQSHSFPIQIQYNSKNVLLFSTPGMHTFRFHYITHSTCIIAQTNGKSSLHHGLCSGSLPWLSLSIDFWFECVSRARVGIWKMSLMQSNTDSIHEYNSICNGNIN